MTSSLTFISAAALTRKNRPALAKTTFDTATATTDAVSGSSSAALLTRSPSLSDPIVEDNWGTKSQEELKQEILKSLQKLDKESLLSTAEPSQEDCPVGSPFHSVKFPAYPGAGIDIQVDYPEDAPQNLASILNNTLLGYIEASYRERLLDVFSVEMEDFTCGYDAQLEQDGIATIPPALIGLRVRFILQTHEVDRSNEKDTGLERTEGTKSVVFVMAYRPGGEIAELHLPLELELETLHRPECVAAALADAASWVWANSQGVLPSSTVMLPCLLSGITRVLPLRQIIDSVSEERGNIPLMVSPGTTMQGLSNLDALLLHCGLSAYQSPYCELPIHLLRQKESEAGDDVYRIAYLDMAKKGGASPQSEILLNALRRQDPDLLDKRGLFKLFVLQDGHRCATYLAAEALAHASEAELVEASRAGNEQKLQIITEATALEIGSAGLISYLCEVEDFLVSDLLNSLED